jgi:hypothetical protein
MPEKVEDWTAPWETATGENEIDKPRLKRYLFGILTDKEKLQGSVTEKDTKITELEGKITAASREGETEVDKLKRELKEAKDAAANTGGNDLELTKLRVALQKGLKEGDVKRLVGSTEAELLADADELLKSFGARGNSEDGEGGDPEGDPIRRTPRGHNNPGDPNPGAGADVDVMKVLDSIPRIR